MKTRLSFMHWQSIIIKGHVFLFSSNTETTAGQHGSWDKLPSPPWGGSLGWFWPIYRKGLSIRAALILVPCNVLGIFKNPVGLRGWVTWPKSHRWVLVEPESGLTFVPQSHQQYYRGPPCSAFCGRGMFLWELCLESRSISEWENKNLIAIPHLYP